MADDGSPQSLLYYFNEESWNRFTKWAMNPTPLRIGHTAFNLTVAQRILTPGKWLGNEVYISNTISMVVGSLTYL